MKYFPSQTSTAKEIVEILLSCQRCFGNYLTDKSVNLFLLPEVDFRIAKERNMSHTFARRLIKKQRSPAFSKKKKTAPNPQDTRWTWHGFATQNNRKKLPVVRHKVRLKGSFPLQRTASNVESGPWQPQVRRPPTREKKNDSVSCLSYIPLHLANGDTRLHSKQDMAFSDRKIAMSNTFDAMHNSHSICETS